jgi:hypothetical protein
MSLRREEQMLIDDQYVDNSGMKNDINEYNSAMGDFADCGLSFGLSTEEDLPLHPKALGSLHRRFPNW